MQVNIVDYTSHQVLKSFDCNATHHLPRIGEDVLCDDSSYKVEHVIHNLDRESVKILVDRNNY